MKDEIACQCDGMKEFIEAKHYTCIPSIYWTTPYVDTGEGKWEKRTPGWIIAGCDDENPIALKFCPFCAEKLKEPV